MKLIIDIPEKTIAHIRSDYGHGIKAIYNNDHDIICDAIFNGEKPKQGKWIEEYDENAEIFFKRRWRCTACNRYNTYGKSAFCPKCGAQMKGDEK